METEKVFYKIREYYKDTIDHNKRAFANNRGKMPDSFSWQNQYKIFTVNGDGDGVIKEDVSGSPALSLVI